MNNLEQLLSDALNNKEAYVKSSGLHVEGTMEQKCVLKFIPYQGISVYAKLEYNDSKLVSRINEILVDSREDIDISYDTRDKILEKLLPLVKQHEVKVANIIYYGISKIDSDFNEKGEVTGMVISYKDGNSITIRNIKNIDKLC